MKRLMALKEHLRPNEPWVYLLTWLGISGIAIVTGRFLKSEQTPRVPADPNRAAIEKTAQEIAAVNATAREVENQVDELASYYGPGFDGKVTASGERFDRWALTCAALDYPLGTWLKITDSHTRRWVIVRVTDRGPYVPGRSIDLSEGAACALGSRERGVVRVRVEVLEGRR